MAGAESGAEAQQLSQEHAVCTDTPQDHAGAMLQSHEHRQAGAAQVKEESQGSTVRQQRPRVSRSSIKWQKRGLEYDG